MNHLNDIENNINSLNEHNEIIHLSNNKDKNCNFSVDSSLYSNKNTYLDNFLYMKQSYIDNMLNFLYNSIYNIYYYLIEEKHIKKE